MASLQVYSPRITGLKLPILDNPSPDPLYIVDYRVAGTADNPQIDLKGVKGPLRDIDWVARGFTTTPQMRQLLNVDPNTYVNRNTNPEDAEGLRALRWNFKAYRMMVMLSVAGPWDSNPYWGSLLGSVVEGKSRLKIHGIDYFVQPEVARRGETLWQTQLYVQANGMINSDAKAVNTIYRFTRPENPDPKWVRSEVERMEKNEGLKEKQVRNLYRQLSQHMLVDFVVRSREILAWPFASQLVNLR
ncbi:MAG: hypothetical protein HYW23_03395 [Candidatus Aenigmarchaeota archaeon]|nr:hypothetical protein [Candidatus Aenigmarchaeota archaeon]